MTQGFPKAELLLKIAEAPPMYWVADQEQPQIDFQKFFPRPTEWEMLPLTKKIQIRMQQDNVSPEDAQKLTSSYRKKAPEMLKEPVPQEMLTGYQ